MNIQGVRILGFISVVLGSATFGVCGWMLVSYQFNKPDVQDACYEENSTLYQEQSSQQMYFSRQGCQGSRPKFANGHDDFYVCAEFLLNFVHLLLQNALFATLLSVFQVVISACLLASATPTEASNLTRKWIIANIGLNLIYLICLTAPLTFPFPEKLCHHKIAIILSKIRYLPAFFTVLQTNVLIGFVTLIYAMVAFKYYNDTGYSLVTNV